MKRRLSVASLFALGLAAAFGLRTGAAAQEKHAPNLLTTDHYMDLERVSDAQIAPDGSRVIYTRQHVNVLDDKWDSELWIVNTDGSHNRFFVKGSAARWSTDGKRVTYLADGDPKGSQVFVRWVD
ncbi:MAG TPA: hypothetical protein VH138_00670, partial [Vicinamibacterales bacterium]|nr:hypothetical protein [Vicinamibacterales bacterium]